MSAVPVKENFFQLTLTAILRLDVVFGEAWVLLWVCCPGTGRLIFVVDVLIASDTTTAPGFRMLYTVIIQLINKS